MGFEKPNCAPKPESEEDVDMSKRSFLKKAVGVGAGAVLAGSALLPTSEVEAGGQKEYFEKLLGKLECKRK